MEKLLTLLLTILTIPVFGQVKESQNHTDFLPKGYVVFEKIMGDLNKDGIEDCVLIIKGTDPRNVIADKYQGQLDRNRRGIIVLFKKNEGYELAMKNDDCFSSEFEDGGVYFPPELSVGIEKGNLYVGYAHGRYGGWDYTFRFQHSDFELIGYDTSYRSGFISDYVTFDKRSINFLSKRKLVQEVIQVDDDGEERFKEIWRDIAVDELIKLSEIKDFNGLNMSLY